MISQTIKQRLLASALAAAPAEATLRRASPLAESLRPDGSWSDLADADHFGVRDADEPEHLRRTLLLAQAHAAAPDRFGDPLGRALDFWLANDFQAPSERQNHLVVPRLVGYAALLFDEQLSAGARGKVTEIMARSRWQHWVPPAGWVDWSGTTLLSIAQNVVLRGCVCDPPAVFEEAFARAFGAMRIAPDGAEGIQPDMTYHASPAVAADGSEGLAYAADCVRFVGWAHGTPWQAPPAAAELLAAFLLDGQQWLMRNRAAGPDARATGERHGTAQQPGDLAAAIEDWAQHASTPRRAELAELARRMTGRGGTLSGHRYFWRAGFSVHQRPAYYSSVSLSSAPMSAEGMTRFTRSGGEYDGFPGKGAGNGPAGTTFLRDTPPPARDPASDSPLMAGGVSEGDYGLAAMRTERTGLKATKSWYYFDQSVVCLGAGIWATGSNQPVFTAVNQCRLSGEVVAAAEFAQARPLSPGGEYPMPRARRVAHDGITYHFAQPSRAIVQVGPPHANTSGAPFSETERFGLLINHGLNPENESYAYVVLPLGEDAAAKTRVDEEMGQLEILANTPTLQAVRHKGLRLVGATFWQAGTVTLPGAGRVAANQPCVLLCRDAAPAGKRLSIANLRREATTVHVEYAGRCLCFELPGGPDAGRSLSRSW